MGFPKIILDHTRSHDCIITETLLKNIFFFETADIVFSSRAAEETAPCSRTPMSSDLTDHNSPTSAPTWFVWQVKMQKAVSDYRTLSR